LAFVGETHDKGGLFRREFARPSEFHAAFLGGLAAEAGTLAELRPPEKPRAARRRGLNPNGCSVGTRTPIPAAAVRRGRPYSIRRCANAAMPV
jgi:hypothetical protein